MLKNYKEFPLRRKIEDIERTLEVLIKSLKNP
jgi:hypothetical protein